VLSSLVGFPGLSQVPEAPPVSSRATVFPRTPRGVESFMTRETAEALHRPSAVWMRPSITVKSPSTEREDPRGELATGKVGACWRTKTTNCTCGSRVTPDRRQTSGQGVEAKLCQVGKLARHSKPLPSAVSDGGRGLGCRPTGREVPAGGPDPEFVVIPIVYCCFLISIPPRGAFRVRLDGWGFVG